MKVRQWLILFTLASSPALASNAGTMTIDRKNALPDDRPVAAEVSVRPQSDAFAFELKFDKAPWGDACKRRCANATFFLDTDDDRSTGLQLGEKRPQTGADLVITVQGDRDYQAKSSQAVLKARVRRVTNQATSLEQGHIVSELDHRKHRDRLQAEGTTVFLLVDASDGALPAGRRARVVYQPPGEKPAELTLAGLAGSVRGSGRVIIEKGRKTRRR